VDKHSSDSRFNGLGVSRTRNLDLWNLYNSEFDETERRGGFGLDIDSESWATGSDHGMCDAGRYSVVPLMSSLLLYASLITSNESSPVQLQPCTALEQPRVC